jgi:6-phosphogluconate dehydrogenase (decarboxylating)
MGRPMAHKLIDAGYDVRGWNRSTLPENLTAGIQLCQKLEAAARADVCLLMLLDSAAVNAVLEHLAPHLSAGRIILDMGSSDPAQSIFFYPIAQFVRWHIHQAGSFRDISTGGFHGFSNEALGCFIVVQSIFCRLRG